MILKAILKINPDAQVNVNGDDINSIEWNNTTPISKADIEAKMVEVQADYDAAVIQEATDKTNGNQKLLDLGLSQAEVDALTK